MDMTKYLKYAPTLLIIAFLSGLSLIFRLAGLLHQYPFWVDEFSSANQAKLILKDLSGSLSYFSSTIEQNNRLSHLFIAGSFNLFGTSVWSAKLPFALFGSFIPAMIYLLTLKLSNKATAFSAGVLAALSYFFITWSVQARSYSLLQLLILANIYGYVKITNTSKLKKRYLILFLITLLLGISTHFFFYLLILSLAVHYALYNYSKIRLIISGKSFLLWMFGIAAVVYNLQLLKAIKDTYGSGDIFSNNIWYYHSFLWREYGLISFLGIVGLVHLFIKNRRITSIFLIYSSIHLIFITILWHPYSTRYLLPLFPLLFIGVANSIYILARSLSNRFAAVLTIFLVTSIIVNGDKFVLKPKTYYSVNHDFREIAVIDYDNVYNLIKSKGQLEKNQTAVIDTWHDRIYWYLGSDFPHSYIFRWAQESGLINGLTKTTEFKTNFKGEKYIPDVKNLLYVADLRDLKLAMKKYPRGFIFIDDASLPKDVIDYAESNFKKELYLDHYPLDDNPYSIWPATLYSWGIK